MKYYIYLFVLCCFVPSGCFRNSNRAQIVLLTQGFEDSTLIYLDNLDREILDSGYITRNKLVFHTNENELTHYCIYPKIRSRAEIDYRYFWKENKQVVIKAKKGDLKGSLVRGSEIQKQADKLDCNTLELRNRLDSVSEMKSSLRNEEMDKRHLISRQIWDLRNLIRDINILYIKNNPNELYSAIVLENLMKHSFAKETTTELYHGLSEKIRNSSYGLLVRNYLKLPSILGIGDRAIDFHLPDINGKVISLGNYRGKYVLLDFWYSGCGPCKLANPILLKYYISYKEKGFEIIGISFDKNKDDWKNSIIKDKIIWPTVSDLQGTDSDIGLAYNIISFPTYYIIDPEGKIIDIIVGIENLDEKLTAVF